MGYGGDMTANFPHMSHQLWHYDAEADGVHPINTRDVPNSVI
jgi:hypothetical protein